MESDIPLITRTQSTTNGEKTIEEELVHNVSSKRDSPRNSDSSSLHGKPAIWTVKWWRHNGKRLFLTALKVIIPLAYVCYIIYAVYHNPGRSYILAIDVAILLIWLLVFTNLKQKLNICLLQRLKDPILQKQTLWKSKLKLSRTIITVVVCLAILGFLAYDWYYDQTKLIPFGGLIVLLLFVFLTSRSPSKVEWTPVIWGVIMQFVLGLIILRWSVGYAVCKFIGDQVGTFLSYTDNGSRFVFGEQGLKDHPVVFKILPVVVFFSAIINILYYWGAMQVIIKAIAHVLRFVMKTSPMESFATSAHIFVGQIESSIALKPFLNDISRSELNAIMTGGFATVAGTVIGAYIEFGVPANHLIAASFMSAPAALAVAKLGWPERRKVQNIDMDSIQLNVGNETNLMEAVSAGAQSTIKLIAYVVVNLIAFLAILSFVDTIISFYGGRIGHPEVDFEWICSYTFMPLALILGIPWKDCRIVATLIGKKIVLNEFLAYIDLGILIKEDKIEGRSAVIATYILCGFGSIAAMGINLGALTAAEPSRRKDYAKGMFRAFVCGNVACFMTACIAGMLYQEPIPEYSNSTDFNMTLSNSSLFNTTVPNTTLFPSNSTDFVNNTGEHI